MESALTSPFERETVPRHDQAALAEQAEPRRLDPRTQRLLLSGFGLVALAGLGALAALFTAPFADPPASGTSAPTSIVPPSAAKTMDKPSITGTTASEALRQLKMEARQREAQKNSPQPKVEALASDDPRWAKTSTPPAEDNAPAPPLGDTSGDLDGPGNEAPTGTAEGSSQDGPATPMEQQSPPDTALPPGHPATPMDQASPPMAPEPADGTATAAIPPAGTSGETAEPPPAQEPVEPAATGAAPSSNVTVTTDVKMRAGPRDEAAVVTVIPNNAVVGLVKCESWCEIVYKGRRGFVYKGFIDGRGVAAKRPQTEAPAQAPAEPTAPKTETPKAADLNSVGR